MPALNNTRWELFCTGLASGKTQVGAYIDAGFAEAQGSSNAWTLAKRPEIKARVAELIESRTNFRANYVNNADLEHLGAVNKAAEEGEISRSWIIAQLMDNVKVGRETNQITASNMALKMLGGEVGMFQDRKSNAEEPTKKPEQASLNSVSIDSINKLLEDKGYTGPPIDLTTKTPPTTSTNLVRTGKKFDHTA